MSEIHHDQYHTNNQNGESPIQGLTAEQWEIGNNLFKPLKMAYESCFDSEMALFYLVGYIMEMYNKTQDIRYDPDEIVPSFWGSISP